MIFLHQLFGFLAFLSWALTAYLHSYPSVHGCGFPTTDEPLNIFSRLSGRLGRPRHHNDAPFRLLAFGDPQLEGDTSVNLYKNANDFTPGRFARDLRSASTFGEKVKVLRATLSSVAIRDFPAQFKAWRKELDLLGNDYYLANIYQALHKHMKPTHVTVLGDLLGSQWISDSEFNRRSSRFWNRVFRNGRRVEDTITDQATIETLGDDNLWSTRIINVAGNHDIGYAGDITHERLARFERSFGKANWEVVFHVPPIPANSTEPGAFLRLIVLNSMNLDTGAKVPSLQTETYDFMNDVITRSEPVENRIVGTIVLTHIPLHKESGVCVDGPFFSFHGDGSVKEQNHISYNAGQGILQGIFGMSGDSSAPHGGLGRHGIILTGHDHEGCDVYHHIPPQNEDNSERRWAATKWKDAAHLVKSSIPGIREVTLRSMMGEFGGYAYLISAWFDQDGTGEWQFEVSTCKAGVQHWWWAVHVLVAITAGLGSLIVIRIAVGLVKSQRKNIIIGKPAYRSAIGLGIDDVASVTSIQQTNGSAAMKRRNV